MVLCATIKGMAALDVALGKTIETEEQWHL